MRNTKSQLIEETTELALPLAYTVKTSFKNIDGIEPKNPHN